MYAKFVFLCVFAWSSINLVQSSLENKTLQSVKSNDTLCEFCVQLIHSDNKTQIATNSTDLIEIRDSVSARKRKEKNGDLMSKILPMLAIPFLVSTSMIPMMLVSMKMMLMKSMFVGKMAIILLALNALWRINNQGGVYSHNINLDNNNKQLANAHYGWNNGEEYGAYINKRKRR